MSKPLNLQILERARAYVANPETWCVGAQQRTTINGTTQYCAWGALYKAEEDLGIFAAEPHTLTPASHLGRAMEAHGPSLVFVNDQQGRLAVLALFDFFIRDSGRPLFFKDGETQ